MFKQEVSRHLQDLRDFADVEWFNHQVILFYSVRSFVLGNSANTFELSVSWLSLDIMNLILLWSVNDVSELPENSIPIKRQSAPIYV